MSYMHSSLSNTYLTTRYVTHILSQPRQDKSCSLNLPAYWICAFWSTDRHPGKANGLKALSASGREPSRYKTEQVSLKSITRGWEDKREDPSLDARTHAKLSTFLLTYIPRMLWETGSRRRGSPGSVDSSSAVSSSRQDCLRPMGKVRISPWGVSWPLYVLPELEALWPPYTCTHVHSSFRNRHQSSVPCFPVSTLVSLCMPSVFMRYLSLSQNLSCQWWEMVF